MMSLPTRGVSVQGSLSRCCLSPGVSVQGWGSLSRGGGLCPGGGGLCPGGWGSLSRGHPHTVKSGWYTSYWNAFLFVK